MARETHAAALGIVLGRLVDVGVVALGGALGGGRLHAAGARDRAGLGVARGARCQALVALSAAGTHRRAILTAARGARCQALAATIAAAAHQVDPVRVARGTGRQALRPRSDNRISVAIFGKRSEHAQLVPGRKRRILKTQQRSQDCSGMRPADEQTGQT